MADIEFNLLPKFLDAAMTPVAKEAGERLSDIVSLASTPIIKAKAKRDLKMKVFLSDLEKELKTIPEGNITEPALSIVGPALEDLFKYYMDEEHIVAAFKKLIAASMNTETKDEIHPLHSWMIRQMSPADAKYFEKIAKSYAVYTCSVGSNKGLTLKYSFMDVWISYDETVKVEQVNHEFRDSLTAFQTTGLITKQKISKNQNYYNYLLDIFRNSMEFESGYTLIEEHDSDLYEFTDYGSSLCNILGIDRFEPSTPIF